jgi:hypothetical protein
MYDKDINEVPHSNLTELLAILTEMSHSFQHSLQEISRSSY